MGEWHHEGSDQVGRALREGLVLDQAAPLSHYAGGGESGCGHSGDYRVRGNN